MKLLNTNYLLHLIFKKSQFGKLTCFRKYCKFATHFHNSEEFATSEISQIRHVSSMAIIYFL